MHRRKHSEQGAKLTNMKEKNQPNRKRKKSRRTSKSSFKEERGETKKGEVQNHFKFKNVKCTSKWKIKKRKEKQLSKAKSN